MPYIKQEDRARASEAPQTAGELNFAFTRLIENYLGNEPVTYERLNAVVGALESSKLEFYRRVVVPYEDVKMRLNGDVYAQEAP